MARDSEGQTRTKKPAAMVGFLHFKPAQPLTDCIHSRRFWEIRAAPATGGQSGSNYSEPRHSLKLDQASTGQSCWAPDGCAIRPIREGANSQPQPARVNLMGLFLLNQK